MTIINVLIADDHQIVADGLRALVERHADMKVIACVQDGRDAVRYALDMHPDIVLMDHAMPKLNGTEATQMIRERCPATRVIMLSMHTNQVHVLRALQAGASGYIAKKSAAEVVVDAIRVVHKGGRYLSKDIADNVIEHVAIKSAPEDLLAQLSSRERQVLQMLAEGQSVASTAVALSLSPKTVETYRARMMDKLNIHNFAGLVRFAIQHGITHLD